MSLCEISKCSVTIFCLVLGRKDVMARTEDELESCRTSHHTEAMVGDKRIGGTACVQLLSLGSRCILRIRIPSVYVFLTVF